MMRTSKRRALRSPLTHVTKLAVEEPVSIILSILALGLSVVTTYLSFFYERSDLTGAMDQLRSHHRISTTTAGEQRSTMFSIFVSPSFIVSLEGTRPLVISDVNLVRMQNSSGWIPTLQTAPATEGEFETMILESGSLHTIRREFELPPSTFTDVSKINEDRQERWGIQLTVYDHKGRRSTPILKSFDIDIPFSSPKADEKTPSCAIETSIARGPERLLSQ